VAKTLLVMSVFRHLEQENAVLPLAAAVGFFWLTLMFILTLSDYLTR
jgi:caa(3)-type oxidase subunit IV